MHYMGIKKVICPSCNIELDVPLYHVDGINRYGMKFCHQCGASLFYKNDNTEHISKNFLHWLSDNLFQSFCDNNECKPCPFGINNNGFGVPCTKLNRDQQLHIFKQMYDKE